MKKIINCADYIIDYINKSGIEVVFGYPGGAALPLYDAMAKNNKVKHIIMHNEQSAVHAAQGYARSTGKIGVVIVTSGPGATNTLTGIADAKLDSIPIVIITAQVKTLVIGTDAFQEIDIVSMSKPVTKQSINVKNITDLIKFLPQIFHLSKDERHGPVLIDVPKDILEANFEYDINYEENLPKTTQHYISEADISKAFEMIKFAKKPIIYSGGGIRSSESEDLLRKFIKITNFPVTNTTMGIGNVTYDMPQYLQMLGMHGSFEANKAMYEADLIIALGVRFDDRVTGLLSKFSPNSKKIHVDIDRKELNKNIKVDLAINGNVNYFLTDLNDKLLNNINLIPDVSDWWKNIEQWRKKKSFHYHQERDSKILPQYALDTLFKKIQNLDPFVTTDVGQHQMWAAQYYRPNKPKHFISSLGLGTMGFGLPSSIGVQIANKTSSVFCITGEGSFMMSASDLGTIKKYQLPIKIVIINNSSLGMVRQWQEMFYENRLFEVDLEPITPDFVKFANSFTIEAKTISKVEELEFAIEEMITSKSAYLLNIIVDKCNVLPMIKPGSIHSEMILNCEDNL